MTRMLPFAAVIAASTLAAGLRLRAEAADKRDLAALIAGAEGRRDERVQEVRSRRQYVLRNARWQTDAILHATMFTSADGSKRYEVLSTNTDGIRKKILMKILEGEVQAAARKDRDGHINADNYELRPLLTQPGGGETCLTVELVPKKRSRFTLEGHGCIDMAEMAMVRMEGRTAKRVSLLIGRAKVVQHFRKFGEFWYSSTSHSTADVRFLGKTELIIQYSAYTITPKVGAEVNVHFSPDVRASSLPARSR